MSPNNVIGSFSIEEDEKHVSGVFPITFKENQYFITLFLKGQSGYIKCKGSSLSDIELLANGLVTIFEPKGA